MGYPPAVPVIFYISAGRQCVIWDRNVPYPVKPENIMDLIKLYDQWRSYTNLVGYEN